MGMPQRRPTKATAGRTAPRTAPQTQRRRIDTAALKKQVGDQWPTLFLDLAPQLNAAVDNIGHHVPCPVHGGTDGFRMFEDGAETGGGVCNTCGVFGDGIKLLQWANGWTFLETVREIGAWLGEDLPTTGGRGMSDRTSETDNPSQEAFWGSLESTTTESILTRPQLGHVPVTDPWDDNTTDPQQETDRTPDPRAVAAVDRTMQEAEVEHPRIVAYYRQRGLSIDPPDSVGYLEAERYHFDGGGSTTLPALVATIDAPDGAVVATFRIFLDPDGDGKANVTPAKKFSKAIYKGATRGGAIRLREPADDGMIVLAEGIETAEAVFQATGIPSWAAGSAGGIERFEPPESVTSVQIWADNDSTGVGQLAANNLARRLYDGGMPVCVSVSPFPDTDWLDVLVSEGDEYLRRYAELTPMQDPFAEDAEPAHLAFPWRQLQKQESGEKSEETAGDSAAAAIEKLNREHFVVQVGSKVHIATERHDPATGKLDLRLGDQAGFKLLHANFRVSVGDKTVAASALWISSLNRREYQGIGFFPGWNVPGWYNLWRGFSVEPTPGNCSLFWLHLFIVICQENREHYRYVRRWLAHMVQRPGELPGVAIVIRGKQGTGKGALAELVGALVSQHYLMLDSMEQLIGRFNGHLKDLLLVYANEAVWAGNRAGEGALKAMVTDPLTPVEEKFKDLVNVRNCKRILVTTNKPWAVPMEADDRRFLVLEASDSRKGDTAYFGALFRQMRDQGGLQALLHDLQREDLSGFDVRKKPASRHALDIKLRSADPIVQWWHECLVAGTLGIAHDFDHPETGWEQTPSREELHGSFLRFTEAHHVRTLTREIFGRELRKMLPPGMLRETRPTTGETDAGQRRRPHRYVLPTLAECRQAFEAFFHAGPETWE
jgi:phage/plasmid primase-like uncharacterized protein